MENNLKPTSNELDLRLAHYSAGGKLIPHTEQLVKLDLASLEAKRAQILKQLSSKLYWSKENRLYFELKLVENELSSRLNEGKIIPDWVNEAPLDLSSFEEDECED